jgi:hypothetical protein
VPDQEENDMIAVGTKREFGRWCALGLLTAAACLTGCGDAPKAARSRASLDSASDGVLVGVIDVVTQSPSSVRYEVGSNINLPFRFAQSSPGEWTITTDATSIFDVRDMAPPGGSFGAGSGVVDDGRDGTLDAPVTVEQPDGTKVEANLDFSIALTRDSGGINVTMTATGSGTNGATMSATITGTLSAWPMCVPACNGLCGAFDGCGHKCFGKCPSNLSCTDVKYVGYECQRSL